MDSLTPKIKKPRRRYEKVGQFNDMPEYFLESDCFISSFIATRGIYGGIFLVREKGKEYYTVSGKSFEKRVNIMGCSVLVYYEHHVLDMTEENINWIRGVILEEAINRAISDMENSN
jgi:hypothetical protein